MLSHRSLAYTKTYVVVYHDIYVYLQNWHDGLLKSLCAVWHHFPRIPRLDRFWVGEERSMLHSGRNTSLFNSHILCRTQQAMTMSDRRLTSTSLHFSRHLQHSLRHPNAFSTTMWAEIKIVVENDLTGLTVRTGAEWEKNWGLRNKHWTLWDHSEMSAFSRCMQPDRTNKPDRTKKTNKQQRNSTISMITRRLIRYWHVPVCLWDHLIRVLQHWNPNGTLHKPFFFLGSVMFPVRCKGFPPIHWQGFMCRFGNIALWIFAREFTWAHIKMFSYQYLWSTAWSAIEWHPFLL